MQKLTIRLVDDRRVEQLAFEGAERRMREGRAPDAPAPARPEIARLSDIDLCRAFLRKTRLPGDPDAGALAAEMERRQLSF